MKEEKEINECSVDVWGTSSWHTHKCSKKAITKKDGKWYCKIHYPDYLEEKERKKEEKYKKDSCKKKECTFHFPYSFYRFCPYCGTRR